MWQRTEARADIERRKNAIERQQAAAYHSEFELRRDRALELGDTRAAENHRDQIAHAADKRAELEIGSVFLELGHEFQRVPWNGRRWTSPAEVTPGSVLISSRIRW